MHPRYLVILFVLMELLVTGLIFYTAGTLPDVVASHFDGAGRPNGFMTRTFYIGFMLVFALGIPAVVSGSMALVSRFPDDKISLPNKHIWLAEPHRAATFAWLRGHALGMGILLTGFMGYVHWLVVLANRTTPAQLSNTGIITGLVVFAIALLIWGIMLPLKFRRLPKDTH